MWSAPCLSLPSRADQLLHHPVPSTGRNATGDTIWNPTQGSISLRLAARVFPGSPGSSALSCNGVLSWVLDFPFTLPPNSPSSTFPTASGRMPSMNPPPASYGSEFPRQPQTALVVFSANPSGVSWPLLPSDGDVPPSLFWQRLPSDPFACPLL